MNKENNPADIIEQYIQEKNLDKLKEILELSKKKVKDLEKAVAQVEEEKLIEAFRSGDKSYLEKVANEMSGEKPQDDQQEEKKKGTSEFPDAYAKY